MPVPADMAGEGAGRRGFSLQDSSRSARPCLERLVQVSEVLLDVGLHRQRPHALGLVQRREAPPAHNKQRRLVRHIVVCQQQGGRSQALALHGGPSRVFWGEGPHALPHNPPVLAQRVGAHLTHQQLHRRQVGLRSCSSAARQAAAASAVVMVVKWGAVGGECSLWPPCQGREQGHVGLRNPAPHPPCLRCAARSACRSHPHLLTPPPGAAAAAA